MKVFDALGELQVLSVGSSGLGDIDIIALGIILAARVKRLWPILAASSLLKATTVVSGVMLLAPRGASISRRVLPLSANRLRRTTCTNNDGSLRFIQRTLG